MRGYEVTEQRKKILMQAGVGTTRRDHRKSYKWDKERTNDKDLIKQEAKLEEKFNE